MNTWTLKDGRWEIRGIEELSADMFCVFCLVVNHR